MAETKTKFYVPLDGLDLQNKKTELFLQQLNDLVSPEDQDLTSIMADLTSENEQEEKKITFDDYFKLLSKVWDHPERSKDAELVTMVERMEAAAPYNVFFNTLKLCPETNDQLYSIKFTDLLCPSLGKLKSSLHVTFKVEIWWILSQYASRKLHKLPMTIIYGHDEAPWPEDETMKTLYPDIDYLYVKVGEGALGCHHSKVTIFEYEDESLRLVIGSANLYAPDWDVYNQQLWVSPKCPRLPQGSSVMDGESPTGFKLALLDYLFSYDHLDISSLKTWIDRVKNADFREIKVAFLYTVPGVHPPRRNGCLVHFLGHLLSRDCTIPAPKEEHDLWGVIAQTASLGLVGRTPEEWLTTNLLKALASHTGNPYFPTLPSSSKVKFNLVYPTMENCLNGYLITRSASCCMYELGVKQVQPWLLHYQCKWKAERTKRTRAIAHSKCYFRISPCWTKMPYMFLTSANLSRSAWGSKPNMDSTIFVRSYETGILFLPKYFGEEYFELPETPNPRNRRPFPMMFDLPLTPYGPGDDSYCGEEVLGVPPDAKEDTSGAVDEDIILCKLDTEGEWVEPKTLPLPSKESQAIPKNTPVLVTSRDMKYAAKTSGSLFFPDFKRNN